MGVEKIFASPGSDWAPLWEALATPAAREEFPKYLSSRHEETAIAMASGYAKSTGKLPAVVLHTTVGALHATMGMRAALHERIPMCCSPASRFHSVSVPDTASDRSGCACSPTSADRRASSPLARSGASA